MRTLALVLGGIGAGGLAALLAIGGPSPQAQQAKSAADSIAAPVLSDTGSLKGPRQPIFFRHDIHAGQFKIQCQYCHYSVAVSPEPGIPSMQTCMGCHLVVSGSDSSAKTEIKKLRQAWNDKKPVEWVRVHYLARHAHFPHQRHIKALGPTACTTCHGDVTPHAADLQSQQRQQHGFLHHLPPRAEGHPRLLGVPLLMRARSRDV